MRRIEENTNHPDAAQSPERIEQELRDLVDQISQEMKRRAEAGLTTILFLPVTGGEGCGKTTLLNVLEKLFNDSAIPVKIVKMLGGDETTDPIRALVLNPVAGQMLPASQIHILQAGMNELARNLAAVVSQADQVIILADRSPWDAPVYQGLAQEGTMDAAMATAAENHDIFAQAGIPVTRTIFVALDPTVGLARKNVQGGAEITRFEEAHVTFHTSVQQGFQTLATNYPGEIAQVQGDQTPAEIQLQVLELIMNYLQLHQAEVIIGTPPTLYQIEYWINRDPLKAARMLRTLFELREDHTTQYLDAWRKISFALRDSDLSPEDSELVAKIFLETPLIGTMAKFGMMNPEAFAQISNLMPAEKKLISWRYMNRLKDAVETELRNLRSREQRDPTQVWWSIS